jgi:hypothetical protein
MLEPSSPTLQLTGSAVNVLSISKTSRRFAVWHYVGAQFPHATADWFRGECTVNIKNIEMVCRVAYVGAQIPHDTDDWFRGECTVNIKNIEMV